MTHLDLQEALSTLIQQNAGETSMCVLDLDGQVLFAHQEHEPYRAASLIKLPILSCALQHLEQGHLGLQQRLTLTATEQVPGAGVLHELQSGLSLTVQDLLTLMVIVSDNTATNLMIDLLGLDTINAHIKNLELKETFLVGKLQLPPERQNALQLQGQRSMTSSHDIARWYLMLMQQQLAGPDLTRLALEVLKKQQHRDLLARHLPRDRDGELRYAVASKSGEILGHRHDAGIVFAPRPYIISVLTRGSKDPREHPDHPLVQHVAALSERTFWLLHV